MDNITTYADSDETVGEVRLNDPSDLWKEAVATDQVFSEKTSDITYLGFPSSREILPGNQDSITYSILEDASGHRAENEGETQRFEKHSLKNMLAPYISGAKISRPEQEARESPLSARVEQLLNRIQKDGVVSKDDIRSETEISAKDPVAAQMVLDNWDTLSKRSNDRSDWLGFPENAFLYKRDWKDIEESALRVKPGGDGQPLELTAEQQAQLTKLEKMITPIIDKSELDENVKVAGKALTKAILNGDAKSFEAVLEYCKQFEVDPVSLTNAINFCLTGSGVEMQYLHHPYTYADSRIVLSIDNKHLFAIPDGKGRWSIQALPAEEESNSLMHKIAVQLSTMAEVMENEILPERVPRNLVREWKNDWETKSADRAESRRIIRSMLEDLAEPATRKFLEKPERRAPWPYHLSR